jgi:hypothetical protein
LRHPALARRIQYFLSDDLFKEEFSHTVIHNKDAFKIFQMQKEQEEK